LKKQVVLVSKLHIKYKTSVNGSLGPKRGEVVFTPLAFPVLVIGLNSLAFGPKDGCSSSPE